MALGVAILAGVVGGLTWWQQARLRTAWWDRLAARGPDAQVMNRLTACESPLWSGWVTVAASDVVMPCGEPLAARQLSEKLDPALRRSWMAAQLSRDGLTPRARWRLTRALELAGAPVEHSTVAMVTRGDLDDAFTAEILLADDGARNPREEWLASRLRATRGEPLDSFPWEQVLDGAWLSGSTTVATMAMASALGVPEDVDPRMHAVPESWAIALAEASACDGPEACLRAWQQAAEAFRRAPDGEDKPREDVSGPGAMEEGLLGPILDYEGRHHEVRRAAVRLLDADASLLSVPGARPWLTVAEGDRSPTLPEALWTGRMGPWTQALWAREVARRADAEGEVKRSPDHLVVVLGPAPRMLCGTGRAEGLQVVLDAELVARALVELHPEATAHAARLAGWQGPTHAVFGSTGDRTVPPDPCASVD